MHVGAVRDDADVLAALQPYVQGDCLVAFDAPLVVRPTATGQPPQPDRGSGRVRSRLNRDCTARTRQHREAEFADVPRAARLAERSDLDTDPLSAATRRAIEVYPHAATVALFRLARTLKYKAKPGRGLASSNPSCCC